MEVKTASWLVPRFLSILGIFRRQLSILRRCRHCLFMIQHLRSTNTCLKTSTILISIHTVVKTVIFRSMLSLKFSLSHEGRRSKTGVCNPFCRKLQSWIHDVESSTRDFISLYQGSYVMLHAYLLMFQRTIYSMEETRIQLSNLICSFLASWKSKQVENLASD